MPVTARLSKLFYDRLGEEVTAELVEWFNNVDATYRADLRELNELNFARFDAKLEQRVNALDSKLEQRLAALDSKLEQRLAALESRFEQKLTVLESRFEQKLTMLESKFEQQLTGAISHLRTELSDKIGDTKASLLRWMFGFWVGTALVILGSRLAL
jgi:DNA anti-recombination protein RmuC